MLDSGATHHICNDEAIMRNLREVKKEDRLSVYSSDDKELCAERMGCIDLKNFSLNPVGLIPSMKFNVVICWTASQPRPNDLLRKWPVQCL